MGVFETFLMSENSPIMMMMMMTQCAGCARPSGHGEKEFSPQCRGE